jgi:Uncharacterized protein involved in methicillin resistance
MTIYTSVNEIDAAQWDELIRVSPTSTFFQTRACYDFYNSLSFLKPFIFAVSENDILVGVLCGYIIADGNVLKRFFSKRAIVPGGALLATGISERALKLLLETVKKELSRKAIYVELRNYNDYSAHQSDIESTGFNYVPHLNFHVETLDVDSSFNKLNASKRRYVRLAKKMDVYWCEAVANNEITEFYNILQDLYLYKVKTPLFPLEFFLRLNELEFGKILVVKQNQKIIGGSVCVLLPDNTLYEWFVCGLDGHIKNVYPSTLATWAAIEYSATNNFKRFDMMGAGKPDEGYGVRNFKSEFGGELVEHGRFLYVCKPRLFALGKYIVNKLKKK